MSARHALTLGSIALVACGAGTGASVPSQTTTAIKVDQVGYLRGQPKLAFVVASPPATRFSIRRASSDATVLEGALTSPVPDVDTGDAVQTADFSKLDDDGTYYVDVPGVGRSYAFDVGPRVYARAFYLATRGFYGQRCGTAVDLGREFPGYAHAACHLTGDFHPSSGRTGPHASHGGWHDAGDYGRYVVNSGIATGTLLWTWELFGSHVRSVDLALPESGDATPDILHEVRWNLDWMLSMQDDDGGVWQKQTSAQFAAFVMPEDDPAPSEVIGTGSAPYKSTCATADLAAVAAIAGRVYQPFDAAYADRNRRAAEAAWRWAEAHPAVVFRNPPGVGTGEYGDGDCGDERLWAAAELWRTTGAAAYQQYVRDHAADYRGTIRPTGPPAWPSVAPLGLWTYALGGGDPATAGPIRDDTAAAADTIVARTAANAYHVSLTTSDYIWGSNSVAANYGLLLLVANALHPDPRYVSTAWDDLHYLLGRNAFSLSWVTGVGTNAVQHPHHRPSAADRNAQPWPGLMAAGPDAHRDDDTARRLPPGLPPAKVYVDDQGSYSTNEIAINWNAPLVFVLAATLPPS